MEMKLTAAMQSAMEWIDRDGFVYAGTNVHKGRQYNIAASTLRGLERRGLVALQVSPDGGMMAKKAPTCHPSLVGEYTEAEIALLGDCAYQPIAYHRFWDRKTPRGKCCHWCGSPKPYVEDDYGSWPYCDDCGGN